MKCISLVGTVHQETGLASISGLQTILERIRPEVIFLEMPSAALDAFFNGTRRNLESSAVNLYRERHDVELVPVDLPTPDEEFFRDIRDLTDTIKRTSPTCSRLFYRDTHYLRTYGFAYLNSDHYTRLWAELYEAMLTAIEDLGDHRFLKVYQTWTDINERREKEMIRRVEDYSVQNSFGRGALLVGAAHRQPIIDKSRMGNRAGVPTIQWDLDKFMQAEPRWESE